jgi:hypothetical protein
MMSMTACTGRLGIALSRWDGLDDLRQRDGRRRDVVDDHPLLQPFNHRIASQLSSIEFPEGFLWLSTPTGSSQKRKEKKQAKKGRNGSPTNGACSVAAARWEAR